MNTLSIIIYLVDLLSNMKSYLIIIGIAFGGWGFLKAITYLLFADGKNDKASYYSVSAEGKERYIKERDEHLATARSSWKQFVLAAIIFFFVTLIPSQKTLYAIALSEVGERVIKLEQVQTIGSETIQLLHTFIQKAKRELEEKDSNKK